MNWEPVIGRGHSHSSRDGFGLACIGVLSLLWSGSATAAVGRVPGDFAVDPSGAAAYTIPINVAPGINGLAPNLALVYNSQAGDGLAGIRWTLAGYSSITRCGDGLQFCLGGQKLVKDAAASNTGAYGAEGVAYRTEIDSFVRVVSHVSGTATSFEARHPDGLTYFYGYTSDSKIPSTSTNTWAVNQIQDKFFNSVRFTYSAADDNNLKQVDWSDHCTAYGCASGSGARYSLVFSYTLRAAAAQRSGYSFGASWTRNKWLSSIDYKLDGVRVHQYQLGIATPTSDGTQRTQVGTITLCGATNSDCFTSTALQWQNGVADWNASTDLGDANWGGGSGVKPYLVGDFDGDGHTDMLAKDSSNAGIWNILRGTGTSFASSSVGSALSQFAGAARAVVADFNGDGMSDVLGVAPGSLNWQVALATGLTGTGTFSSHTTVFHQSNTSISYTPTVLDYDGDGLADLAYFTASDAPARIRIAHNPGVHNNSSIDFDAGPAPSAPNPNPNLTMRSADFDGDGRQDLLVGNVTNGNLQWLAYRYAGTSGWQLIGGTPADVYVAYSGTDISAIDVNGDGLADLAYYQENTTATSGPGWQTMISKGATGFESPQAVSYTAQADATSRFAAVVDYDGDGRGDLLTHNVSGSPVAGQGLAVVHLSNGTSLNGGLKAVPLNGVTATTMSGVAVYAMDSTGDGLRDVVAWVPSTARYSLRTHKQAVRDLVTSVTDGLGNSISAITYTPLTDSSNYSTAAYPPSPALQAIKNHVVRGNAMQVVSQYTTTDGIGGSYNLNFSYWNLWVSTAGNTSLGFRQVKRHDGRSGAFDTVEQYRQDSPYSGRLAARAVCQQQNSCAVESGPKLSLTTNTWGKTAGSRYSASDPYYYFVFPTEEDTTEFDPANGTTAIRVTKHSLPATNWNTDLGVPNVDTVIVYPSAQATAGWETTRTYTFGNGNLTGTGVWCLGLPTQVSVYRLKPGEAGETRLLGQTYDDANCAVKTRTVGAGSGLEAQKQLVSTLGYDVYGNLSSLTESAGSTGTDPVSGNPLVSQSTTYAYAAEANGLGAGYHRTSQLQLIAPGSTDLCGDPVPPVQRVTQSSWDYRLGQPKSIVRPTSERTTWDYDAFGRVTAEDQSAGSPATALTHTGIAYTNCSSCFPAHSSFKVRSTRSDGFWSESYIDAFGRKVGEAHVLLDGQESRQTTVFDALGRVAQVDVPYIGTGSASFFTTYQHNDPLGRLTQENGPIGQNAPSGATTGYAFAGLNVTVTDAESRQKVMGYNANGNLVSVTEKNPQATDSVTTYEYTAFDELKKIIDAGTNSGVHHEAIFGYDGRGFMISRSDGDRGSWSFDYDPWGKLELETHPRGTTRYDYDAVGQLKNRIDKAGNVIELTTSWGYRNDGLPSTTSTGGYHAEIYTYNNLAQLVDNQVNVQMGSTLAYLHTYRTYDGYGRLDTMTYPQSVPGTFFKAKYRYSLTGYSQSVAQDVGGGTELPIYTVGSAGAPMDAMGRVTRGYFGSPASGPRESYDYDPANLQLSALATTHDGANGYLQRYSYQWDKVGNLKQRKDLTQNVQEDFTYDPLNRLDFVTLNGGSTPTMDLSYHPDGSIATKAYNGTVGTYNYGTGGPGAGPHALSNISNGPYGGTFHYDTTGNLDCRAWNGSGCAASSGVTWWSFNLPQRINGSAAGGSYADFSYGANRERVRQTAVTTSPATNRSTYYIGPHFEVEVENNTPVRYRSNVFFNGRMVYSQLDLPGTPPGLQAYYVHQDYQGSVDRLSIAGGTGSNQPFMSFDAYGKRRSPNWTNDTTDAQFGVNWWTERGYTGHEHLDNVRMINMNGRVQDPIWGRMLSPDPVIGDLTSPQSVNAYSYVGNNPSSFTDPSGFDPAKILRPIDSNPIDPPEIVVRGQRIVRSDPFIFFSYNFFSQGCKGGGCRVGSWHNPNLDPGPVTDSDSKEPEKEEEPEPQSGQFAQCVAGLQGLVAAAAGAAQGGATGFLASGGNPAVAAAGAVIGGGAGFLIAGIDLNSADQAVGRGGIGAFAAAARVGAGRAGGFSGGTMRGAFTGGAVGGVVAGATGSSILGGLFGGAVGGANTAAILGASLSRGAAGGATAGAVGALAGQFVGVLAQQAVNIGCK